MSGRTWAQMDADNFAFTDGTGYAGIKRGAGGYWYPEVWRHFSFGIVTVKRRGVPRIEDVPELQQWCEGALSRLAALEATE